MCGVGSRGALVVECDDGEYRCRDCRSDDYCDRCHSPTDATLIDGTFRCESCQEAKAKQRRRESRDANQQGLEAFDA
ncbi:hypothetical protein DEQ92_20295 [Haloferax sp. Atlit-6N]|nr:hypothetical protein DEQ92_20295 [Haloferax sp. Atlit-6N]